jgi:hypothetical protein
MTKCNLENYWSSTSNNTHHVFCNCDVFVLAVIHMPLPTQYTRDLFLYLMELKTPCVGFIGPLRTKAYTF